MKSFKVYQKMLSLIKPSCKDCKFLNKIVSENGDISIQSTCKKFLVSPMTNIYFDKSRLGELDYRGKYPYTITARFDITMCGLDGKYFVKKV